VIGIATYAFGDYVKYSGVCSIITAALVIKTYGYPSLTPKGKKSSAVTFKMLGYMSEVIIFGMIGFGFFQADNQSWSWHLVLNQFTIIIVSRCLGVFFIVYLCAFCCKRTLPGYKLAFLTYAGLIKGAICYGLM